MIHEAVEGCYLESTSCLNEVSVRLLICRTMFADADTRGKQRVMVVASRASDFWGLIVTDLKMEAFSFRIVMINVKYSQDGKVTC
jgi:hypothetical protein